MASGSKWTGPYSCGMVPIWHDGLPKEVIPEIPAERTSRFNDVIADPRGRVFCGTMSTPERKGRLYRVDPDGSCNLLLEEVGCSNRMAFDADCRSSTTLIRSRMRFMSLITISRPVTFKIKSCLLDLLKRMACQMGLTMDADCGLLDGALGRKRKCSAASERRG